MTVSIINGGLECAAAVGLTGKYRRNMPTLRKHGAGGVAGLLITNASRSGSQIKLREPVTSSTAR